jgi:hypothetical protein
MQAVRMSLQRTSTYIVKMTLSKGDTDKDAEQIITEDIKLNDVEINDYIMVKFMSKKQHFYRTGQVEQ